MPAEANSDLGRCVGPSGSADPGIGVSGGEDRRAQRAEDGRRGAGLHGLGSSSPWPSGTQPRPPRPRRSGFLRGGLVLEVTEATEAGGACPPKEC